MKEVIEHINPTDRANRYKADFDTAGSPRIIRANLGPAAKAELKEDKGDQKAGWYNWVWRGQYEFVGEAGRRLGQAAVILKGTEKKANRGTVEWSMGKWSTI